MYRRMMLFLLSCMFASMAYAQCDEASLDKIGDCTVQDLIEFFSTTDAPDPWRIEVFARRKQFGADIDQKEQRALDNLEKEGDARDDARAQLSGLPQARAKQAMSAAGVIAQSPAMPTEGAEPGDGVHAASQNFVTPWSIALDSVEKTDDGQSLFIRRNGVASITVAIHNVENPFNALVKSVEEDEQEALEKKLRGHLNDFDDWSVSIARDYSKACSREDFNEGAWCVGRKPELYSDILAEAIAAKLTNQLESTDVSFLALAEATRVVDDVDLKLTDLTREQAFDLAAALRSAQRAADEQRQIEMESTDYSKLLAALIANQPQVSLSANYRRRDPLVGRNEWSALLEFGTGFDNIGRRLRGCGKTGACDRLLEGNPGTNRLTASIGYTALPKYELEIVPSDVTLDFEPLQNAKLWVATLLWSRDLPVAALQIGERNARFSLEGSFRWVDKDPTRPEERTVVTATLTLPVGSDLNLPISLRYANEPEFLGDSKKQIGMHFGITYKLPFGKKPE